jgi:hypothetical protein
MSEVWFLALTKTRVSSVCNHTQNLWPEITSTKINLLAVFKTYSTHKFKYVKQHNYTMIAKLYSKATYAYT